MCQGDRNQALAEDEREINKKDLETSSVRATALLQYHRYYGYALCVPF